MKAYFVGVDLGQSRDFTAIAVVEMVEVKGEWDAAAYAWRKETVFRLRFLERVPLGTPYPEVVDRVVEVTRSRELAGRCHVAVDGTGVGRPVVDLLRSARPGGVLMPAIITNGDFETRDHGYYRVPKRDLIIGLQVLLQGGALQISSALKHGPELVKEMADMQVRVTPSGNEQYGAWREGTHDDLIFAVALACWCARKVYPAPEGDGRWWRPYGEDGRGW
ncbi:conserved hypothetical protein [Candidatus Sulfopaludibacter sp. SbA4]|nr:conserved hypothetical protein [Candidatus Sulfopaludibacter sp. SbA4]